MFGVDLTIYQQVTIILVLMLTSKGAAGVTGSGFIVLASTLSALQVIPLEGLALLLGVDRFMSEGRAIVNLIGNGIATIIVAKSENEFDEVKSTHSKRNENGGIKERNGMHRACRSFTAMSKKINLFKFIRRWTKTLASFCYIIYN